MQCKLGSIFLCSVAYGVHLSAVGILMYVFLQCNLWCVSFCIEIDLRLSAVLCKLCLNVSLALGIMKMKF